MLKFANRYNARSLAVLILYVISSIFTVGASAEETKCNTTNLDVFTAIQLEDLEQIECILGGEIDLNKIGIHGHTALWESIVDKNFQISMLLVTAGADFASREDNILLDVIANFAVGNGEQQNDELIQLLNVLLTLGADMNLRGSEQNIGLDIHYGLFLVFQVCQTPDVLNDLQLVALSDILSEQDIVFTSADAPTIESINRLEKINYLSGFCVSRFRSSLQF